MSSIDSLNNSSLSALTSTSSSTDSDPYSSLSPEERKLLIQAQSQEGVSDPTGLLGLSANKLQNMATGSTSTNKFTQVGASNYLSPPSAPKVKVTQRQIDAYHSMTQDVHTALTSMTAKMQGKYLHVQTKRTGVTSEANTAAVHAQQKSALIHQAATSGVHNTVTRAAAGGAATGGAAAAATSYPSNNAVDAETLGALGSSYTDGAYGSSTMSWANAENGGAGNAATQKLAKYIQAALGSMNSTDMMTAFMTLQVTNQNDGLSTRQALSTLSSQMRQDELQNEVKQDQAAEKSAQKALAKAKKLGVLTKVLAVFTVVLTAVLAALTLGLGSIGFGLVMAAMLTAGVANGAKEGKKNGDGFDMTGFLNGAAMGGDIAMAAVGGLEIMAALEATEAAAAKAASTAAETATKDATKQATTKAATTAATAGGESAAESAAGAASQSSKDVVMANIKKFLKKMAEESGAQKMADVTKEVAQRAIDSTAVKGMGEAAKTTKTMLKSGGETLLEKSGVQGAVDATKGVARSAVNSTAVQGAAKGAKATTGFLKTGGVDLTEKMGGALGPKMLIGANIVDIGGQTVGQIGQAYLNFRSNMYNADSEEHQQNAAIFQKNADIWEDEYEDLQNYMQQVSQSHSNAVNQAMQMLTQHFQSGMRAAQNISG